MTFFTTITDAINDITAHGFDSQERIDVWVQRIKDAAHATLTPPAILEQELRNAMLTIYQRMVERDGLFRYHPKISGFTIERLKPHMRLALDKRIMSNAALIKLNRESAVTKTLQRFVGWSTSIPKGGSKVQDKVDVKSGIRKALVSLPFEERRVIIDQGHKFTSSLNHIVATEGGAIAGIWHSHWRQVGYNYREDHKERDEHVYLMRDSWARTAGLVKIGPAGYLDDITQPGEEVFCRCFVTYLYTLDELPLDMLTSRGKQKLDEMNKVVV